MSVVINGTSGITGNTGTLISASTIGVGGATPSASGAGITFPATQSASTDANTLDDYEEGTWTPTIRGGSSSGTTTYTNQNGKYTKVGNLVVASGFVRVSAMTGTGNLTVSLPFSTFDGLPRQTGSVMTDSLDWPFSGSLVIFTGANTAEAIFYVSQDNASWGAIQTENSTWEMYFSVSYYIST